MLCEDSRALQEEKRLFLFPDKDSVNKKPWTQFTIALSASIYPKVSPYLPAQAPGHGSLQLQIPYCNSLLIPNKPIFTRKIIRNLFKSTNDINLHT